MKDVLRLLRYNTGTDKKAFIEFKEDFDAVIFNATIVAYSGSSVADLVSMYKRKYIIDPQTHIFQQDISAIMTKNKKTGKDQIKKSVDKYLGELPKDLVIKLLSSQLPLSPNDIRNYEDELVSSVYAFQTTYIDKYISDKKYKKYLDFVHLDPEPRMIIAPYFMLKDTYSKPDIEAWLEINSNCLSRTIKVALGDTHSHIISAQLVIDKDILLSSYYLDKIISTYAIDGYEYLYIWIDDFNAFDAGLKYVEPYFELVKRLNEAKIKPIMAYGGYESIILCNSHSASRLYGVAQSVGYGEYRPITPVGGGMPVNKYYFLPIHCRMRFDDAARILQANGFFSNEKTQKDYAEDYYRDICNCSQCHEIIGDNIDDFGRYNDSIPFEIHNKNGVFSRNRPTTEASFIAARHFLYSKVNEWAAVENKTFDDLLGELKTNCHRYEHTICQRMLEWCKIYEQFSG